MSHRHRIATTFTIAAVALIASAAPTVWAQNQPTDTSLAPAGQGPGVNASSPATSGISTRSRASVKAATRSAEQMGTLKPAGEAANPVGIDPSRASKALAGTESDRSRAMVKKETRDAASAGELKPAGQAPLPVGEAPKK